jgi:hypothetical protein
MDTPQKLRLRMTPPFVAIEFGDLAFPLDTEVA